MKVGNVKALNGAAVPASVPRVGLTSRSVKCSSVVDELLKPLTSSGQVSSQFSHVQLLATLTLDVVLVP